MPNDNPILNNPYREPSLHYATNLDGELDYQQIVKGRRLFNGTVQTIPVPQGAQRDLPEINDQQAQYGNHLVNIFRREVKVWRDAGYPMNIVVGMHSGTWDLFGDKADIRRMKNPLRKY